MTIRSLLELFGIITYATEVIISPLADTEKPIKSFAQIVKQSSSSVLGTEITMEDKKDAVDTKPISTVIASPAPTIPLLISPTPLISLTPTRQPSPSPTPTPIPTPSNTSTQRLWKNPVKIAFLGDSMIDTLGQDMPEMKQAIQTYYPNLTVNILNYGVGATNIDYGIQRITNQYEYLGRSIPSLASQHPNIVVIESFAYNPYSFDEGAIDKHWLALANAVDTIRQNIPQARIVIAATVAPNAKIFGDGAGLSFSLEDKQRRINTIKQYLESTIRFARSQQLPLANAYHPSLQSDGNGNPLYINPHDHIHPSEKGRSLFAQRVAETLVEHKLLEL